MHQGVIGQRGIGGHALGQLQRLVQSAAGGHQVLGKAQALAVGGVVHAPGHHHVGHARHANQLGDAHRPRATDKNAARALGQGVKRAFIGHPDVAGAGQLQPAANHGAVQSRNDGYRAELHRVQGAVPGARMHHALAGVAFLQFAQVQASAKVIALTMQHRGAYRGRHVVKSLLQIGDQAIVQGIALERARQSHQGHSVAVFDVQVGRGHGVDPGCQSRLNRLWLCFITISSQQGVANPRVFPRNWE